MPAIGGTGQLEVEPHTQVVEKRAVVEAVVDVVAIVEQERVFHAKVDKGLVQHVVFQTDFEASRAGVLDTLAVESADVCADIGARCASAEVVICKKAGGAILRIFHLIADRAGDALANTVQKLFAAIVAELARHAGAKPR